MDGKMDMGMDDDEVSVARRKKSGSMVWAFHRHCNRCLWPIDLIRSGFDHCMPTTDGKRSKS